MKTYYKLPLKAVPGKVHLQIKAKCQEFLIPYFPFSVPSYRNWCIQTYTLPLLSDILFQSACATERNVLLIYFALQSLVLSTF